jgi:WD40 repeat protein
VSGSQDGQIRVWDGRFPKKQSSLCVLRGHSDAITCLHLHWTTVVSGSTDKTVRAWHFYDCPKGAVKSVRPHQRGVVGLYMNEGSVVSGSLDGKIKLWRDVLSYTDQPQ